MQESDKETFLQWHTKFLQVRADFENACSEKIKNDPGYLNELLGASKCIIREMCELKAFSRSIHKKHVLCAGCSLYECEMDDTVRYDRLQMHELAEIDDKEETWEAKRRKEITLPLRERGHKDLEELFWSIIKAIYDYDDWACKMLDKYETCSNCKAKPTFM